MYYLLYYKSILSILTIVDKKSMNFLTNSEQYATIKYTLLNEHIERMNNYGKEKDLPHLRPGAAKI